MVRVVATPAQFRHLDWNPAPREPRFEAPRPPKRRRTRKPPVVTRPVPKAEPLDGGTDLV
jgi:hypothetical protein